MKDDDLKPLLYANCIPVKGNKNAIVCDLQRQRFLMIPMQLFDILMKYKGLKKKEIKEKFSFENHLTIDYYFNFLEEKKYLHYVDDVTLFPNIDLCWDEPLVITNGIIDLSEESEKWDWNNLFLQFSNLGCEHLQIRSFIKKELDFYQNLLNFIGKKRLVSISLLMEFSNKTTKDLLTQFIIKNPRVCEIVIFNSPVDSEEIDSQGVGSLIFTSSAITSESHCGVISPYYFSINIKTFTEAQNHNTCLNRKISIDQQGFIKNCPSMKKNFGHIATTKLADVVNFPEFTKYWLIKKDDIEKCKDCEFRYICTDCRAFVEHPENVYSSPLKCGYDPYSGKWEDWSINPLKESAIKYYELDL